MVHHNHPLAPEACGITARCLQLLVAAPGWLLQFTPTAWLVKLPAHTDRRSVARCARGATVGLASDEPPARECSAHTAPLRGRLREIDSRAVYRIRIAVAGCDVQWLRNAPLVCRTLAGVPQSLRMTGARSPHIHRNAPVNHAQSPRPVPARA